MESVWRGRAGRVRAASGGAGRVRAASARRAEGSCVRGGGGRAGAYFAIVLNRPEAGRELEGARRAVGHEGAAAGEAGDLRRERVDERGEEVRGEELREGGLAELRARCARGERRGEEGGGERQRRAPHRGACAPERFERGLRRRACREQCALVRSSGDTTAGRRSPHAACDALPLAGGPA